MAKRKSASRKTKRKTASPTASQDENVPDTIRFHYLKSNFFRVIHVDGAHGGITPRGHIQMALFNDRLPIPQQTVQRISVEGKQATLGDEVVPERVQREGIVREVEVEAIMTPDTARTLIKWLKDRLRAVEAASGEVKSMRALHAEARAEARAVAKRRAK